MNFPKGFELDSGKKIMSFGEAFESGEGFGPGGLFGSGLSDAKLFQPSNELIKIVAFQYCVGSGSEIFPTKIKSFNAEMEQLGHDGYRLVGDIRITTTGDYIIYTASFKK
jgi:hypothetical protein